MKKKGDPFNPNNIKLIFILLNLLIRMNNNL